MLLNIDANFNVTVRLQDFSEHIIGRKPFYLLRLCGLPQVLFTYSICCVRGLILYFSPSPSLSLMHVQIT